MILVICFIFILPGYLDMSDPLGPAVTRNLCDKLYDKRKQGAQEVDVLVRELSANGDKERILRVVDYLIVNFSTSPNGNQRKGALIALAAVVIALGTVRYCNETL